MSVPREASRRQPVPSLFKGPPQHSTSAADVRPQAHTRNDSTQTSRQQGLPPDLEHEDAKKHPYTADLLNENQARSKEGSKEATEQDDSRVDAMWAEMQNTLEEVELSATSGAHVFSADHARALEELRKSQIALAQAWARSEAEDDAQEDGSLLGGQVKGQAPENKSILSNDKKTRGNDLANTSDTRTRPRGGSQRDRTQLEEETENDIVLARRRRLANDRYFERVNRGVVDVVNKLEGVAKEMRDVETVSQDIWGSEHDSLASTASSTR